MNRHACHAHQCDWKPAAITPIEARDELTLHARDANHPLCQICHLSLRHEETITCERCLTRSRKDLHDLIEIYTLLPLELGRANLSVAYDSGTPGASDGAPLPGGNVLTLLGPGSPGGAARRLPSNLRHQPTRWWVEGATGPLPRSTYRTLQRQAEGREHETDNDSDTVSIIWFLANWENDWRHTLGHPEIDPARRHVADAAGYLETHTRWAATDGDPDVFRAYSTELRQALEQVKHATSTDDRPLRAPASCFSCGENRLQRIFADPKPCHHKRPSQQLLTLPADPKHNLGARCETPLGRRTRLHNWHESHKGCAQGGLVEEWKCAGCGRTYDPGSYWLAVRGRLEETS